MLTINLICVGGLKEKYLRDACAEYIKRMTPWARVTVTEVPEERCTQDSPALVQATMEKEGRRMLDLLPGREFVTALCVEGRQMPSEKLAAALSKEMTAGCSSFAFLIGGSSGLSDAVKSRARLKLSMSEMTFPHQLARVMLLEQLYRALTIQNGIKYHK